MIFLKESIKINYLLPGTLYTNSNAFYKKASNRILNRPE